MVNVAPFRGLRYSADVVGDWGAVLGPPYDIVDAAQTEQLKASHPHQIAHIETASGDDIAAAAALLADWRSSGAVIQDDAPCYYLHEHRFGGQVRRALLVAVELRPWGEGVMAHERTMPGPKATRTALRTVVGADVSPLMAFAPDADGALQSIIDAALDQPPLHEGVDPTGDAHTLRQIDDPAQIGRITQAFARDTIYMADGHHRYESALAAIDHRPASRQVLMGVVCANDPALVVGATHRVVRTDLPDDLLEQLSALFSVSETSIETLPSQLPDGSANLGLVTPGVALLLEASDAARDAMPDDVPEAWRGLAPAILQHVVLEPILGIDADALAGGSAVTYTHHLSELAEAVANGHAQAGFALPAPTLQDVIDTADAGSFMPQKSTYFVPKLPTGLVLHPLD